MIAKVAVYDSHEKAVNALKVLADKGFPMKYVSLLSKAEVKDEHIHINGKKDELSDDAALLGAGGGALLGLLAGLGVFSVPGFGFLYGAGAAIGALGGFDLGIVAGGLGSLLVKMGLKDEDAETTGKHLGDGKYALVVKGPEEEVAKAIKILQEEGNHLDMTK